MPKVHTHLHLALILLEKMDIEDKEAFLLGNAYPDCFDISIENSLAYHYKKTAESECDLVSFLNCEEKNCFNLGYYFHLWIDNFAESVDLEDIVQHECLICDMEAIFPVVNQFKEKKYEGKSKQALDNILKLEKVPMPLCLVFEDKKQKYRQKLEYMVNAFILQKLPEMRNKHDSNEKIGN